MSLPEVGTNVGLLVPNCYTQLKTRQHNVKKIINLRLRTVIPSKTKVGLLIE
jgi:hypothetical protein